MFKIGLWCSQHNSIAENHTKTWRYLAGSSVRKLKKHERNMNSKMCLNFSHADMKEKFTENK